MRWQKTWNTAVLTTACVTLGVVLGVAIEGGFAPPVSNEPWLKTYQGLIGGLIGAGGTLIGLYVATRNVRRQMQFNLYGREEDRMERTLPGLRDAASWLDDLAEECQLLRIRQERSGTC